MKKDKNKLVFIAGQNGMVGSAVYKLLKSKKKYNILDCSRKKLDLTNQEKVYNWIKKKKPDIVINAAGRVGGILDNSRFQDEYLYINSMIGLNLANACHKNDVHKFINLGSACIYPKDSKQPIKESSLLSSKLEPTNEGYALAKILVLKYCEYLQKKFKKNFITLQPANLYGEGDNFDLQSSHVMPALIRKFHEAVKEKKYTVEVWGSGIAQREFLHVDDLARAIYFCMNKKIKNSFVNVSGADSIKIIDLCKLIKKITNFKGEIIFNKNYPDGVLKRKLENKILSSLGWKAKIKLNSYHGIKSYYEYFKKNIDNK